MKKAKIMLLAIAVVATVGGALAFKANKMFNQTFCTRALADQAGQCQGEIPNYKLWTNETANTTTYFTVEKVDIDDCTTVQCPAATTLVHE